MKRSVLSQRFEEAMVCAARLHARQKRKGTKAPYVSHLLGVASLVLEHGGDEDEAIAALLHDAIEDQGGDKTRQQIRCRFGDRVTEIVDGCTDADTMPKPRWRKRKEAYLVHLPTASASVRLVSAADKVHNARTVLADYRKVGEAVWKRFKGRKEGTLWYYQAMAKEFTARGPQPLAAELAAVVGKLVRLARKSK